MKKASYYPVFLNLDGRKCTVFGGGEVALRKVKMLSDFGAEVTVISPALCPGLAGLADRKAINALRRDYQPSDLKGAFIAIAATDDRDINTAIASEARELGVLVNVVNVPELCDFIVSAYVRRGDVTIAVSTAGKSPALARKIRARLEQEFGEEYAALAQLVGDVRSELKELNIRADGETWQEALDLDLLIALLKKARPVKPELSSLIV
jgi:precorrin-2 dehydrogenase/sirohydrochlorin ferrochelatase